MTKSKCAPLPVCECGSREFQTHLQTRNSSGRLEYRLRCRGCGVHRAVDKTTFALFRYLNQATPSRRFLKLFDLA